MSLDSMDLVVSSVTRGGNFLNYSFYQAIRNALHEQGSWRASKSATTNHPNNSGTHHDHEQRKKSRRRRSQREEKRMIGRSLSSCPPQSTTKMKDNDSRCHVNHEAFRARYTGRSYESCLYKYSPQHQFLMNLYLLLSMRSLTRWVCSLLLSSSKVLLFYHLIGLHFEVFSCLLYRGS